MNIRRKILLLLVFIVVLAGTLEKIAISTHAESIEIPPRELSSVLKERGHPGIVPSPTVIEEYRRLGKRLPKVRDWSSPLPSPPVTGERDLLIIMIDFPDMTGTQTQNYYNSLLFGSSQGQMKHYYHEVSYGLLTIDGTFAGTGWYRSYNYMTWWGADSYYFPDQANEFIFELAREAVLLADSDVDFSVYDVNSNHVLDPDELSIVIVHSGDDQAETGVSTDIWSHRWYIFGEGWLADGFPLSDTFVDGVRVSNHPDDFIGGYTMQAESSPMGTFAHEFGHDLGLPDLYDTDYTSDGIGAWGLMAYGANLGFPGGTCPAHPCAWSKMKLGWIDPNVVTESINDAPVSQAETNPTAYLLPYSYSSPEPLEYFLVENREKTGYDTYLPGSGILVWHVDESVSDNDDEAHKLVDLEESHGGVQHLDTYMGIGDNNGDPYDPYFSDATGFGDETDPNCLAYDDTTTGLCVTDISEAGGLMTVDFLGGGQGHPSLSELNDRFFSAPSSSVYFVPTGNIYDDSALYAIYAYKENPQIITPSIWSPLSSAYLDEDGSPLFDGNIVTFGGRFANRMVAYYEDAGIARVGKGWNGTHHLFVDVDNAQVLYAFDAASYDPDEKDYFITQIYMDGDRYVLSEWGLGAKGTYATGLCFIDIIYPNLQDYIDQYYIYSWTDLNDDDIPQLDEISLETSGS